MSIKKHPLFVLGSRTVSSTVGRNWANWCKEAREAAIPYLMDEGILNLPRPPTPAGIENLNKLCFECAHRLGHALDAWYCTRHRKFEQRTVEENNG